MALALHGEAPDGDAPGSDAIARQPAAVTAGSQGWAASDGCTWPCASPRVVCAPAIRTGSEQQAVGSIEAQKGLRIASEIGMVAFGQLAIGPLDRLRTRSRLQPQQPQGLQTGIGLAAGGLTCGRPLAAVASAGVAA